MRVSFILPAYKRRFLREAIASILGQTCRDLELVVVDDCSTMPTGRRRNPTRSAVKENP